MAQDRPQARVVLKRIVVTAPTGERLLVLGLDIDCDECGQTSGNIFGHHLRTLHAQLGKIIEEFPELCGTEAEVVSRTEFQGVVDPRKVSEN